MINRQFDGGARVCENCGTHMEDRSCKLVCPKCKVFRSCSDLF